uniref:DUF3778 domain-containing protein n=1 Tax=Oryza meridionalis TaxID=40149 RepID=A0A0E0ETJ0_9ORYZ
MGRGRSRARIRDSEHGIHAGSTVRVEQFLLLRFNGGLRGISLLSPVMPTPKSTAQQLTSDLCCFRGGSCRSFSVCQAGRMLMEAQGSSRRGSAAELRRHGSLLLFSFIWKFGFLDRLPFSILIRFDSREEGSTAISSLSFAVAFASHRAAHNPIRCCPNERIADEEGVGGEKEWSWM